MLLSYWSRSQKSGSYMEKKNSSAGASVQPWDRKTNKRLGYLPIAVASLKEDTAAPFNVYVVIDGRPTLFLASGESFDLTYQKRHVEFGMPTIYVASESVDRYQRHMETRVVAMLNAQEGTPAVRAQLTHRTMESLFELAWDKPESEEVGERITRYMNGTLRHIARDRELNLQLMDLMGRSKSVFHHSVNVCVYSLIIGGAVESLEDREIVELGIGGLVHDIGKLRISERILRKEINLTPKERDILRQHPRIGSELLGKNMKFPSASLFPVAQHHERADGDGYPEKLELGEIHLYSRIVAIANVFDHLTCGHEGRAGRNGFQAFHAMFADKGAYDQELLKKFMMQLVKSGG